MIAIIDYDAGNIKSVEKSLNYLGEEAIITRDHDEIVNSDKSDSSGSWSICRCDGEDPSLWIRRNDP